MSIPRRMLYILALLSLTSAAQGQSARQLIMTEEGYRSQAYADCLHGMARPTVGYGTSLYTSPCACAVLARHDLTIPQVANGQVPVSRELAGELLDADLAYSLPELHKIYRHFAALPPLAQAELASMLYQLGPSSLRKFHRMNREINRARPNWRQVARYAQQSRWGRQTPARAARTSAALASLAD